MADIKTNYLAVRPERVEGRTVNCDTVLSQGEGNCYYFHGSQVANSSYKIYLGLEVWNLGIVMGIYLKFEATEVIGSAMPGYQRAPLKGPFEQTPDEFRVSHPLNFDGSCHPCLGRDIWVWVDF